MRHYGSGERLENFSAIRQASCNARQGDIEGKKQGPWQRAGPVSGEFKMMSTNRIALIITASALVFGVAAAPMAMAAEVHGFHGAHGEASYRRDEGRRHEGGCDEGRCHEGRRHEGPRHEGGCDEGRCHEGRFHEERASGSIRQSRLPTRCCLKTRSDGGSPEAPGVRSNHHQLNIVEAEPWFANVAPFSSAPPFSRYAVRNYGCRSSSRCAAGDR